MTELSWVSPQSPVQNDSRLLSHKKSYPSLQFTENLHQRNNMMMIICPCMFTIQQRFSSQRLTCRISCEICTCGYRSDFNVLLWTQASSSGTAPMTLFPIHCSHDTLSHPPNARVQTHPGLCGVGGDRGRIEPYDRGSNSRQGQRSR